MTVRRAPNLDELLAKAKAKLRMKKKPLSAFAHAPPGPRLADTLSLLPMATVMLTPDPPPAPADEEARDGDAAAGAAEDGDAEDGDAARADEAPAAEAEAEAEAEGAFVKPVAPIPKKTTRRASNPAPVERGGGRSERFPSRLPRRLRHLGLRPLLEGVPPRVARKASIVAAVEESGAALTVLVGATGSGKDDPAPQLVLGAGSRPAGRRRARSSSRTRHRSRRSRSRGGSRGRGEAVGDVVGYATGGDVVVSRRTRVTFCTTGVLLRRLADDPKLDGVTHVFVDEAHERSADADVLLAHLRRIMRAERATMEKATMERATMEGAAAEGGGEGAEGEGAAADGGEPNRAESSAPSAARSSSAPSSAASREKKTRRALLKVVLMSATADADAFARYFSGTGAPGSPDPPTPRVEGRAFPVEERFAPEERSRPRDRVAEASASASASGGGGFVDYDRLARVAVDVAEEMSVAETRDGSPPGAILAFLPGAPERAREKAVRAAFEKHLFSGPGPRRRNGKKTPVPRGGGAAAAIPKRSSVKRSVMGRSSSCLHGGLTAEAARASRPRPRARAGGPLHERRGDVGDDSGRRRGDRHGPRQAPPPRPERPGRRESAGGVVQPGERDAEDGPRGRVREGLCVRLYPRSVFGRDARPRPAGAPGRAAGRRDAPRGRGVPGTGPARVSARVPRPAERRRARPNAREPRGHRAVEQMGKKLGRGRGRRRENGSKKRRDVPGKKI